jgi:hypothetical protein
LRREDAGATFLVPRYPTLDIIGFTDVERTISASKNVDEVHRDDPSTSSGSA